MSFLRQQQINLDQSNLMNCAQEQRYLDEMDQRFQAFRIIKTSFDITIMLMINTVTITHGMLFAHAVTSGNISFDVNYSCNLNGYSAIHPLRRAVTTQKWLIIKQHAIWKHGLWMVQRQATISHLSIGQISRIVLTMDFHKLSQTVLLKWNQTSEYR